MSVTVIQAIAGAFAAIRRIESGKYAAPLMGEEEALALHYERLNRLAHELPNGSGFDTGTTFDYVRCNADRIVLAVSFHHMDEHGGYDGWTDHSVVVTPSLAHNINVRVTGRDRNGIKDYIGDTMYHALTQPAPQA